MRSLIGCVLAMGLLGCSDDAPPGADPLYPVDYAQSYVEVRACRFSLEHDLMRIRVFASPDAAPTYMARTGTFAANAIIVKQEYDSADMDCSGAVLSTAAIQKLEPGSAPDKLDWRWQRVDESGEPAEDNLTVNRCVDCHTDCGGDPVPFDGTCSVP